MLNQYGVQRGTVNRLPGDALSIGYPSKGMLNSASQPFKRQSHKMVKHTQTIRRLLLTNCLNVFDDFVGLALKGLTHFMPLVSVHTP